jgi:hypothetical protein
MQTTKTITDLNVIKAFVENTMETLISRNLRVAPIEGRHTLFSEGKQVAVYISDQKGSYVKVRENFSYLPELISNLKDARYYPINSENPRYKLYGNYVPKKYRSYRTIPQKLWEAWYIGSSTRDPRKPLVYLAGQEWKPVRAMSFDDDKYVLKLTDQEVEITTNDYCLWAEKTPERFIRFWSESVSKFIEVPIYQHYQNVEALDNQQNGFIPIGDYWKTIEKFGKMLDEGDQILSSIELRYKKLEIKYKAARDQNRKFDEERDELKGREADTNRKLTIEAQRYAGLETQVALLKSHIKALERRLSKD